MDLTRNPARAVGFLIAAFLSLGIWIDLAVLHLPQAAAPLGLAFVIAVIAFGVTEAVVMHVELGKNAHSVSLAELTLCVSLFFVPASHVTAARILGGGAVLLLVRRQRPLKLAFNLALWVLDTAVAVLVFQALHGSYGDGALRLILPGLLPAVAAALVDSVAVNAVISLTSLELDWTRALAFVKACVIGSLGCATGGLVVVGALAQAPWLLVPSALVLALYLTGFNNSAALRQQHESVQVMYDFAGELAHTGTTDEVVDIVLRRCVELLRAERATLMLFDGGGRVVVTSADGTGVLAEGELHPLVHDVARGTEALVLRSGTNDFLASFGMKDAVLAPLAGDHQLRGVLVISDRLGEVNTFTQDDALLLQMLVSHAVTALANSRLVERLDHESLHDSLTGLANRAMFQDHLARAGDGIAVLLMDLDRFKEVNDTLGHHHGDLLLQEIAARLSRQMRTSDLLARLGGDEFAVLLQDIDEEAALSTARRLHSALSEPIELDGVEIEVGASIGVVHRQTQVAQPDRDQEAMHLLQRADVAMYAAKQHYAGVHLYRDELDGYSPRRLALASGLRSGIEQGQMTLRYQPQARVSDGAILGVEALVRWEHPTYGMVAPDDFISIAEQTGQIRELTRFVLDRALEDCAHWTRLGTIDETFAVSVNLSVRNLLEPDLPVIVRGLLAKHGVPATRLTLEITESHLMSDPARTAEILHALSELGCRLSVDDFGTGYSSLAYLKQLPVREVKIDKSFVAELTQDAEDAAIIEAIISLAHTLRLEVVAEGVEDEPTIEALRLLGCDLLQGYHLARPMPAADLLTWLADAAAAAAAARRAAVVVPWQRTAVLPV